MMKRTCHGVDEVYGTDNMVDKILRKLTETGKTGNQFSATDFSSFDELHVLGRPATIELGRQMKLKADQYVLDIGSGLGGASRTIAEKFGSRLTGIDLSEDYHNVATRLTEIAGLSEMVSFHNGNALDMPFKDCAFDAAVMIHMNMNIADKNGLFKEASRVIKLGGTLGLWEICRGCNEKAFIYPVPWAEDESTNFLVTMDEMIRILESEGFQILQLHNASEEVLLWGTKRVQGLSGTKSDPLGVDIVMKNFRTKLCNNIRNLQEERTEIIRLIAVKRA